MRKTLLFILSSLLFFGCEDSYQPEYIYANPSDSILKIQTAKILEVLKEAESVDSLNYSWSHHGHLLFIRAGYIIDSTQKHALVVSYATDTTVHIELWSPSDDTWSRRADGEEYYCNGTVLDVTFSDFNFDNRNDVFVIVHCTNGIALTTGHLFSTESGFDSDYLEYHREASELANPIPDTITKTVVSDSIIWCKGLKQVCKLRHTWTNGQLARKEIDCPCVGDE